MPCVGAVMLALLLTVVLATGSNASAQAAPSTVPVLMLSDIHFDPFHDPAKFSQLQAAPVDSWTAILAGAPSPDQASQFESLQTTCGARGVDTPMALLQDSLAAAHAQQSSPLFITVSGDLLAHQFDCRFRALARKGTAADYTDFAEKTIAFLALRLRQSFPGTPVYFALGNNDSNCRDYREDTDSAFLRAAAESFAADAGNAANSASILQQFPQSGDYSVILPAPMKHARLIVLQDLFESRHYASCGGDKGDGPAREQIAWLRAQLTAARAAHEKVWVMGHIPPGVDAYATLTSLHEVCGAESPVLFLNSPALVDTLTSFPDVIRLALFAHTHMDEMRLLTSASGAAVAAKLVPSISPVDGNNPAFTLAEVDPGTAILKDYAVYAASNQTGIETVWNLEYRYSKAYGMPDFSSASVARLTSGMETDKAGTSPASRNYETFYFVGLSPDMMVAKSALMRLVWPSYACSLSHTDPAGYRACRCAGANP